MDVGLIISIFLLVLLTLFVLCLFNKIKSTNYEVKKLMDKITLTTNEGRITRIVEEMPKIQVLTSGVSDNTSTIQQFTDQIKLVGNDSTRFKSECEKFDANMKTIFQALEAIKKNNEERLNSMALSINKLETQFVSLSSIVKKIADQNSDPLAGSPFISPTKLSPTSFILSEKIAEKAVIEPCPDISIQPNFSKDVEKANRELELSLNMELL